MTPSSAQKTLATERLFLMPISRADLADLHMLHSDAAVMKYIREPEKSLEQTRETLNRMLGHAQKNLGFGFWKIISKEEHTFVGWVGLFPLDTTSDFELGYRTHAEFWGQGLVVEAADSLLKYAKQNNLLTACSAIINPENIQSRRVLEKLEFKYAEKATHYGILVDKFIRTL